MGYKVLIVEDSTASREFIASILSQIEGTEVVCASSGFDALKLLPRYRFDLIITDINMPIMDGLKLVRRIRSDETYKDVPIIVVTTEGSQEDRQRALTLGANAYITKPIQAPQVIAKVKELLKIE